MTTHERLRPIVDAEIETVKDATRAFVATRNPHEMVVQTRRVVELAMNDQFAGRLEVLESKLRTHYHHAIQDMSLSLGADSMTHRMAQSLDARPLSAYLEIAEPALGATPRSSARAWFGRELDDYLHAGDIEGARTFYQRGREMRIASPTRWLLLRGAYTVARRLPGKTGN
jgi:hypothetical protein